MKVCIEKLFIFTAAEKWGLAGVLHTNFDLYYKFLPQYPCIDAG